MKANTSSLLKKGYCCGIGSRIRGGACLNKSSYTEYEHGFNIVNVAAKYLTGIPMGGGKKIRSSNIYFFTFFGERCRNCLKTMKNHSKLQFY